jgi:ABC-type transport system involved in Fe-S cluster assembly fused permease/ATPase subunit
LKNFLVNYKKIGECLIDVEKCVEVFSKRYQISQWHDEYRLIKKTAGGNEVGRISISEDQAKQIIERLDLMPMGSPNFNHAKTWVFPGG